MTDSPEPPASPIDAGVAKAIALGLGLLLILGTALLIVLLLTQKSEPDLAEIPALELQASEKIVSVTALDGQALFLVESVAGQQRVLLLEPATGARSEIAVRKANDEVIE